MLERVLEPEVMGTAQEALEYDEMDHQAVNELFVDELVRFLEVLPQPDFTEGEWINILDLGTGTARIPILLAERLPQCRIMAADASTAMLDIARINIDIAQLLDRIQLTLFDAKIIPYANDYFTGVMSNSIIHHIPDPRVVFEESVRVVAPDGWFFFRDLVRPESEKELARLVETHCGQETPAAQKLFADSLRAALTVEEVRELVVPLGFHEMTVLQTSDRHWTWATRKKEE